MDNISITMNQNIATVALTRGKVNALSEELVEQIHETFADLKKDASVRGIIFTGHDKFFSFGFDVPGLYNYTPEEFTRYLQKYTGMYTHLFTYPKPIVIAINGHAVGGGCMLTLTGDYRIMVSGRAKISLNEITFGSSVFAGSVEMLRHAVGGRTAERILTTGVMFSAEEAFELGLVDQVVTTEELSGAAQNIITELAVKEPAAFTSAKGLVRNHIAENMRKWEADSIREFVDIWYSESTRAQTKKITIR